MIHILLTILKILGILLLVILGIVLFLVLAILFVPFRYAVWGEKQEQNLKAKIVCSWLAHLVHFRFIIENKKKNMELYLFGIPVFALKNKITVIRQKLKKKEVVAIEESTALTAEGDGTIADEQQKSTEEDDSIIIEETASETISEGTEDGQAAEDEMDAEFDAQVQEIVDEVVKTKKNPIKNLVQTIRGIPDKIKATVEKIRLTIKNICGKIKKGSDFLGEESTKATIRLLFGKLKVILGHILPKKARGNITFGFEDPALTGEVLGVLSMFYPKYYGKFTLVPMFDRQVLEGNVVIKGRIVVVYLVWQAVKVVLDKNVRITLKNVKEFNKN